MEPKYIIIKVVSTVPDLPDDEIKTEILEAEIRLNSGPTMLRFHLQEIQNEETYLFGR